MARARAPLGLLLALGCGCGSSPGSPDAGADAVVADAGDVDVGLIDADDPDAVAVDAPPDATPDAPSGTLMLGGAITPVHDPSAIAGDGAYYVFSTGQGLPVFRSPDLLTWSAAGQVFASKPPWITTTSSGNPNELWAPDISYFNGKYHLYYSASTFGSRNSCIGHATSVSLAPPAWVDGGAAVICSSNADPWNAIDPNHITDADGQGWLVFGSWWGGIKAIALDANGDRQGTNLYSLANRANNAVEAPYVIEQGGYYYLFESIDNCCNGANSTYKQMVGRSENVTGPYVDRDGVPLMSGGGTLLLTGGTRWRGPGHNAILRTGGTDFNVYHSYDADNGGRPTLRISVLSWGPDGWPVSAGP